MIRLPIGKAKSGMILAEHALDAQGVLLLRERTELSSKNIRILKAWGVARVVVEGEAPAVNDPDGDASSETAAIVERELKAKFAEVMEDEVMTEIMKAATKYLMDKRREEM